MTDIAWRLRNFVARDTVPEGLALDAADEIDRQGSHISHLEAHRDNLMTEIERLRGHIESFQIALRLHQEAPPLDLVERLRKLSEHAGDTCDQAANTIELEHKRQYAPSIVFGEGRFLVSGLHESVDEARRMFDELEQLHAVLSDIANSMKRDWVEPGEHANWCVEQAAGMLPTAKVGASLLRPSVKLKGGNP